MDSIEIDFSKKISLSPQGFSVELLRKVTERIGLSIEDAFGSTKHKNKFIKITIGGHEFSFSIKQVFEYLRVCFFALALHKEFGMKFKMIMEDHEGYPDIFMIQEDGLFLPIEVTEAYDYSKRIQSHEMGKIAEKIYQAKGKCEYANIKPMLPTLFVCWQYKGELRPQSFFEEIRKYKWENFSTMILSVFQSNTQTYLFYPSGLWSDLLPLSSSQEPYPISFGYSELKEYMY